ncbi:amino acid ABC transporter permease [Psychrilyobacter piezotolerans]|uniref:amino acid ABC transporter permease n=1 Tax=Psychrilyobacter piezotolerans TaxID=2293438 RepID=UPI001EE3E10D|nr:amino acid ABC transporter permease [Psychrilyobacter piezotolerans]MCS5422534.1 amino acid ABC transporter permease [Psychrilyobacter sp. S5]
MSAKIVNITLLLIIGIIFWNYAFSRLNYESQGFSVFLEFKYKFIFGFFITIMISIFSLICSLIIGSLLAMGQKSRFLPLHYFTKIFIEIIRGTPLIVQVYLFFYVVGTALDINNRYLMGVLIMATFSGAYVAEIIRGGIDSIDKTQIESAKALGFTNFQKYRYIILPQVIKRVMPPLAGQFASLIKDSSLLSIIAVNEFTKNVQEVDSITFTPIENYAVLAVGYILLTYPISHLSKKLEKRFSYGD